MVKIGGLTMKFSEVVSLIARKYKLSVTNAAITASQVLRDRKFDNLAELAEYLDKMKRNA